MSNKKISQLNQISTLTGDELLPIVQNGETKQGTYNDLLGLGVNSSPLGGAIQRTFYTRSNPVQFIDSGGNIDLFSGNLETSFGSRNFPSSFFSGTYLSKIIHFRLFGQFVNSTGNINVYLQIGSDKLTNSDIGAVTLSQPQSHPMEILGELIFNGDTVRVCYSLGHCDNQGDFKRYPLSDGSATQNVSSFSGGDLQLIVNDTLTTIGFTTYAAYIQTYN